MPTTTIAEECVKKKENKIAARCTLSLACLAPRFASFTDLAFSNPLSLQSPSHASSLLHPSSGHSEKSLDT